MLISADYSQIELRVLAHLSKDAALSTPSPRASTFTTAPPSVCSGPNSGLDPHELRRRAKIINYALLYGKTAFTLAKDIGVTQQAAQEFIDAYFAGFPGVRAYIDHTLEVARADRRGSDLTGRRRLVPETHEQERHGSDGRRARNRQHADSGHGGRRAEARHDRRARRARGAQCRAALPARMILTVHDELLFEAPEDEAADVASLVQERMERAFPLDVPLTVDVGIGRNWKEAKP